MLHIEGSQILGFTVTENIGSEFYAALNPITHISGAAWLITDPSGQAFTDSDGTIYHLRRRTQAEIEATMEFQTWQSANQIAAAQGQAKVDFGSIPAWMRTGTASQGEAWIDANVTTLANAKVALKALVRIVTLLRDYVRFTG
jgi:hypothetical protein